MKNAASRSFIQILDIACNLAGYAETPEIFSLDR